MRTARGFSLIELAVVFTIVALLLGSLMYTLSAQVEQRAFEETRRRIELARELVLSFAIVNGRLPCPARSSSIGFEVRIPDMPLVADSGKCKDAATAENYYGGNIGGGVIGGFLPAATVGFQPVDSGGFAVDAWGNRIRYVVANTVTNCSGTLTLPHFTYLTNLRGNGISCQSNDLLVCKSSTAPVAPAVNATFSPAVAPSCGANGANQIMSTGLVAVIIFSTGKNGATSGGTGADEATNLKTNVALAPLINPLFVFHPPTPVGAANGEFDDQFTWITVGEFYGRLIAAGQLP